MVVEVTVNAENGEMVRIDAGSDASGRRFTADISLLSHYLKGFYLEVQLYLHAREMCT